MGLPGVPWNAAQRAAGSRRTRQSLFNKVYWRVASVEREAEEMRELADAFDLKLPGEEADEVGAALHRAAELLAEASSILEPHGRRAT